MKIPNQQCSFILFDISEVSRFRRYIKYNDDLIYANSTMTMTPDWMLISLSFDVKGEWLVDYLLSEFDGLYLATHNYYNRTI